MLNLTDSYQVCDKIMRKHSKSFYHAFSQLPTQRFKAITAVYAFCRYVDDLVDESNLSPTEIAKILQQLEETIINETYQHPTFIVLDWWRAFVDTLKQFAIPTHALIEQIHGQQSDLTFAPFSTYTDLENYCKNVAGSVGAMLFPMLAADNLTEKDYQIGLQNSYSLGIGMQLTNILRDIGEDARNRQRVYISQDLLGGVGKQISDIFTLSQSKVDRPQWFITLWEQIAQKSDDYYRTIEQNIHYFHPTTQLAILSAAKIYHAIEDEVRNDNYNCLYKRQVVSLAKRTKIVLNIKTHTKL